MQSLVKGGNHTIVSPKSTVCLNNKPPFTCHCSVVIPSMGSCRTATTSLRFPTITYARIGRITEFRQITLNYYGIIWLHQWGKGEQKKKNTHWIGLSFSGVFPQFATASRTARTVNFVDRDGNARNSSVGVDAPDCLTFSLGQFNESSGQSSSSKSSSSSDLFSTQQGEARSLWLRADAIRSWRDCRNFSMRKPSRNSERGLFGGKNDDGPRKTGLDSVLADSDTLQRKKTWLLLI